MSEELNKNTCACNNCECKASAEVKIEKDGQSYCCQACAEGSCQRDGSCKCSCSC